MTSDKSRRWAATWPRFRPIRGWLGLLLAGAERGVLRETSVAAALLSERDPFRAAERWPRWPARIRPSAEPLGRRRSRLRVCRRFTPGLPAADRSLEFHPGAAHNVLRAADQLYHLADFPRARRAERPDVALMHALLDAFPDRLAKLRAGTQDRALMVGGRGVRIDAARASAASRCFWRSRSTTPAAKPAPDSSRPSSEPGLPNEMLQRREELFFNPTQGQVEARLRTYWVDLMLDEAPVAISDKTAAADLLGPAGAPSARPTAARGRHRAPAASWPAFAGLPTPCPISNCHVSTTRTCSNCCPKFATACGRSTNFAPPTG